ncbi:hypothetical protein WJX73_004075 [Symbiochloris irregularis]|uniref:Uncharacterized protein n=1 Tax=Symbiochloris irregularis TaxID=706552 RepID=A0AAW1NY50_9CHLO
MFARWWTCSQGFIPVQSAQSTSETLSGVTLPLWTLERRCGCGCVRYTTTSTKAFANQISTASSWTADGVPWTVGISRPVLCQVQKELRGLQLSDIDSRH